MQLFKNVLLGFSLSLLMISCNQFTEIANEPQDFGYDQVDEQLWTYFDRFAAEAKLRNLNFDQELFELTAEISSISDEGVAGTCQWHSRRANHVTVDLDFWNRASDIGKEFVVFHELGHCILYRDHFEDQFENGVCQSIMRSGTLDCTDAFNRTNREYYLDELFSILNDIEF